MAEVSTEGVGLHTGMPCRVFLRSCAGPVLFCASGVEARIDELAVVSTLRATTVEARRGALRVGTVEHLFAALAGRHVHDGVAVTIEGPEMPLLDGGAATWCALLDRLEVPSNAPRMRVTRDASIDVGPSRFEFSRADHVEVSVRIELDGVDGIESRRDARWTGTPEEFRARIAPARTFALARDVEQLAERGLARHADPTAVVVLGPCDVHYAGRPFSPDEPARHKLLDLIGDLYLYGGPPIGRVKGLRPGHDANHRALGQARAEGILAPAI